ncbi:helix-turn-helix domain-containing protein [Mucilaginibacter flavus]|uniref:helix-turn-helix domain-containing protein n=1 Tax=Mucilaginibacter flavus TaxID=931504 RepID=UPI0025B2EFCE|nr:AraC family transcriptional regulator [Mucilaginibacter flavus]MDN3580791.1 AraC family transcriptional regulator [Mucilaginibacter flavus]
MLNTRLVEPFEVQVIETNNWDLAPKVYNFFEIIYVMEGEGLRYVNANSMPYRKGNILLYTPLDQRTFTVEKPSRFLYIRFTDVVFEGCSSPDEREALNVWMKNLEYLFFNHNHEANLLVKSDDDCHTVKSLIKTIHDEYLSRQLHHEKNIRHLLQVLLNIFARNVLPDAPAEHTPTELSRKNDLLTGYIKKHIYDAEKLTINNLANFANLSGYYVGEYFKKNNGVSIRSYILQYKLSLVKVRLEFSDLTISEIAYELGFTDESHLSNLFKKNFQESPSLFRKRVRS